jgi:hypothetical protein
MSPIEQQHGAGPTAGANGAASQAPVTSRTKPGRIPRCRRTRLTI